MHIYNVTGCSGSGYSSGSIYGSHDEDTVGKNNGMAPYQPTAAMMINQIRLDL